MRLGPQPKGGQSPISIWVLRFGEWVVLNRDLTPFQLLRSHVHRLSPPVPPRSSQSAPPHRWRCLPSGGPQWRTPATQPPAVGCVLPVTDFCVFRSIRALAERTPLPDPAGTQRSFGDRITSGSRLPRGIRQNRISRHRRRYYPSAKGLPLGRNPPRRLLNTTIYISIYVYGTRAIDHFYA